MPMIGAMDILKNSINNKDIIKSEQPFGFFVNLFLAFSF